VRVLVGLEDGQHFDDVQLPNEWASLYVFEPLWGEFEMLK
jgi:hypothetical protein